MLEYCLRLERMGYRHVVSPYAEIGCWGEDRLCVTAWRGDRGFGGRTGGVEGLLVRHGLGERDCYYPAEYPAGGRA